MFTWYQGERNVGGEMQDIWYIIKTPYRTSKDAFVSSYPPKGATVVKGPRAAYETIKQLYGEAPQEVIMRMGVMDIDVTGKDDKITSMRFINDPDHIYEAQIDLKDATYLDNPPKHKAKYQVIKNKKTTSRGHKTSASLGEGRY